MCRHPGQVLTDGLPAVEAARAISLIDLPWTKCSRRIRAIVSTTSIPAPHETLNETNRDEVTRDLIAWLDRVGHANKRK